MEGLHFKAHEDAAHDVLGGVDQRYVAQMVEAAREFGDSGSVGDELREIRQALLLARTLDRDREISLEGGDSIIADAVLESWEDDGLEVRQRWPIGPLL